jgi:hypothetical protein
MELANEQLTEPLKHEECPLCMEPFNGNIYKVKCGSSVDHLMCTSCEEQWRAKMPLEQGVRMTCPTCRQPETEDFRIALTRFLNRLSTVSNDVVIHVYGLALPPPPPQRRVCASGRICLSRSIVQIRKMTKLRCRICHRTACCNTCRTCVTCESAE